VTIPQSICQRGLIDQATARAVNNSHAAFCFRESRSIEQMMCVRRKRCVQSDEVRNSKQFIEVLHQLDLQRAGRRG
jgi:hypothetical protein